MLAEILPASPVVDLCESLRQIEIAPADDAVFDEPLARFGHLLLVFFALQKLAWVADGHGAREAMHMLDAVEHLLDGRAQLRLVDEPQDEETFRDLPEGLERLIQGVLFRVGVEPAKDIRGSRFLQFDGGDKAQDIVPERDDVFGLAIRVWFDFPGRLLGVFAATENI